jgi:hypothetical protein
VYYRRAEFLFLWAKGIHKEKFPVCGGKCLSGKAVHKRFEKFSQRRSKFADNGRPGAEVAETTVKKTSVLRVSTHW